MIDSEMKTAIAARTMIPIIIVDILFWLADIGVILFWLADIVDILFWLAEIVDILVLLADILTFSFG